MAPGDGFSRPFVATTLHARAYSPEKLDYFTRQILFLRPGTFLVFDRVKARAATMAKTWLLQAMEVPEGVATHLSATNGPRVTADV